MGDEQKRAMFSVLIVLLVNLVFAIVNVNYFRLLAVETPLSAAVSVSLASKLIIFFLILFLLKWNNDNFQSLAQSQRSVMTNIMGGVFGGIGIFILIIVLLNLILPFFINIESEPTSYGKGIVENALVMIIFYAASGFQEEILRAFLITRLQKFNTEWMSITFSALYFVIVQYYVGANVITVFIFSFALGTYYVIGRSLTSTILTHTFYRWLMIWWVINMGGG